MKRYLSTLLLCAATSMSSLWAWQPTVSNFNTRDYEAGTQNWQIIEQANGWIYAANNYGLLEFDGTNWSLNGIWNSTALRSVTIADNGEIYVGGSSEFGKFSSNSLGGLDYKPLSLEIPDQYKNFGEVWNLHLLHDKLYVQTRNYLFKEGDQEQWDIIDPKAHIYCSAKIREGIFMATTEGIYYLMGNQMNALRGSELLRGAEVKEMQAYGEQGVLIGTDFDGVFLYDGNEITPFDTKVDDFIRTNQLFTFKVGQKHIVYGTVLNGIVITDLDGGNPRIVNRRNGLQNNTVLSLLFDKENNLWAGLDQGIDKIEIDSPITMLYGKNYSYGSGYASAMMDSYAYFGTNQGLYVTDKSLESDQAEEPFELIQGSMGQVWSLMNWQDKLLCCHNRGLFEVKEKEFVPLMIDEGFWQLRVLPNDNKLAIGGSYDGLYLLEMRKEGIHILHKIKGFEETSRKFEIDALGNIWILSSRGLEHLTLDKERKSCSAELIRASYDLRDYYGLDKIDNQIVISNYHYCRIVNESGQLEENPGFFSQLGGYQHYSQIKKDEDNNLWYIAKNSFNVLKYDMRKREYMKKPMHIINEAYFFLHGFTHINLVGQNKAIVGAIQGFALADLENITENSEKGKPSVSIRRMISTMPTDSVVFGESYPKISKGIRLEYECNSIRFEFASSLHIDNSKEYSVRLIPSNDEWSEWTDRAYKEYVQLSEGKYEFEVRVRSSQSDEYGISKLSFVVLPPWYRTWWAYLLQGIFVLLIGYSIYKYFKRNIEYGKRKLARQKDEEMRERERQFAEESHKHEKEILKLQNDRAGLELKNKSQELANVLLNEVNKNELLDDLKHDLQKIYDELQLKDTDAAKRRINSLQNKLTRSKEQKIDWTDFEENFDLVNDQFIRKLTTQYPWINKSERKLCVYIRMGLLTKEIAPLLSLSVRGVEMLRYRMRKKMELDRSADLEEYFQNL